MEGYNAKVVNSWKALTVKEKISYKETDSFTKLDEVVSPESSLVLTLGNYITIRVENPKSENPEYNVYVIVADNGDCYVTSSDTFNSSINSILEEISSVGEDEVGDWELKIYKRESNNFKGKHFLTCSIQ